MYHAWFKAVTLSRALGPALQSRHVVTRRPDWSQTEGSPALFLNQRGTHLGVRSAHDIITGIATRLVETGRVAPGALE